MDPISCDSMSGLPGQVPGFSFFFFPCRASMMVITASGPTDRKRKRTERGNVRLDPFVPLVIITRTGRKSPEDSFRTPSFVVLCLSYPTFLGLHFSLRRLVQLPAPSSPLYITSHRKVCTFPSLREIAAPFLKP